VGPSSRPSKKQRRPAADAGSLGEVICHDDHRQWLGERSNEQHHLGYHQRAG
jgi:hypothetical protein